jgi:hypothetical protein
MSHLPDEPLLIFAISFLALWLSAWVGAGILRQCRALDEDSRQDFGVVVAATLTLLGLIIGFTFSMAISRYDQRKSFEEAEANAIGTEYSRADLLPSSGAQQVRALLKDYVAQRVSFYGSRDEQQLVQLSVQTNQLQKELWSTVLKAIPSQPTSLTALVVSGMNDVLNSQGYTEAAWRNRIPIAAWLLMALIALFCNAMIGYSTRKLHSHSPLLLILPLVVSLSFFLIADIDSPRGGIIHVGPQNLLSLAAQYR